MEEEKGQYTPPIWAVTAFIFSIIIIAISFFAKHLLGFLRKDINGSFSSNKKVTVIFILGGPASGKSTQSENIVKRFGYTHLSAGDLLRNEVASGSKNGPMIQKIMKEGKLVPSEITVRLLLGAMEESKSDKFLIDGFPRSEENRTIFENITGIAPEFVLFLDCSEEVMKKRLLSRYQGREDDNINTIMKRFKVFKECTLPVIEYYSSKGKVHKIVAGKPAEDVFNDIKRVFSLHGVKATLDRIDETKQDLC
ncbi:hypothetical protein MRB53_003499 [Persea americana]|uniref:Uncharacterized protein n=1 Tax=Persea americana TaxID=3435 RepID=A0ACC2MXR2_PERAE|nr:hypothetical protein MRB53_003499 [Persea americana]